MSRSIRAVAVTTVLGLTGAVAAALTGPASAGPVDRGASQSGIVSHAGATTKAEQARITAYWTPARMRHAIPADVLVADRDKSSASGRVETGTRQVVPTKGKPGGGGGTGLFGAYYTGGGLVTQTTGKVFFTLAGVNYVCSGSSTSAGNHDLVMTAGHCVNQGPGAFATNWAFVPAYDDGARPYGTFTFRELTTTTQWASSGDFDYDVAFAVVNPSTGSTPSVGKHLSDAVGSQGIAFNQPRSQHYYSFGYPAAQPYDGTDIAWCHGDAVQDTYGGSTDEGLYCNLTGGSSGGPWLRNYNTSTGVGTLTSLNSFKYRVGPVRDYMFGPYLGSVAQTLYTYAAAR